MRPGGGDIENVLFKSLLLPTVVKARSPILHQMIKARTIFTGPNTPTSTSRICTAVGESVTTEGGKMTCLVNIPAGFPGVPCPW